MSFFTFKDSLTSFVSQGDDLHPALEVLEDNTAKLIETKMSLIEVVLIPARTIMTEYVQARQKYLNDTEPPMPENGSIVVKGNTPSTWKTVDSARGKKEHEWHSPLTHTFSPSSLSTQSAFGQYNVDNGLLDDWGLERWQVYRAHNTLTWTRAANYTGSKETLSNLTDSAIAPLATAPYSLDITGRHTVENLTVHAANWSTGMKWIWSTNNGYLYPNNIYLGTYNTWGINDAIDNTGTSIEALCARLAFNLLMKDLNNQFPLDPAD